MVDVITIRPARAPVIVVVLVDRVRENPLKFPPLVQNDVSGAMQ